MSMRKHIYILLLGVCACAQAWSATLREVTEQWVDSAYQQAMEGHLPQAVTINNEGLQAIPEDSMDLRCEFYSCLLYCYHRLGDYEKALYYGELCLRYDEQRAQITNDQSPTTNDQSSITNDQSPMTNYKADLSASLGNLAGIYSSAGQQEVAINYLERAITIENELLQTDSTHTPKSLAIRKAMLGEVLLAKGTDLDRALALTQEALAIDRSLDRRLQVGMRLAQLGHIYEALGKKDQARLYTQQALDIARETGNKMTEVLCLLQLERYEEAASIAQQVGLRKQEYEACDHLYKQSADIHQYAEALRWLERARTLHEQLINEENQRQLTLAQVQYDTFRKEQQLAQQQQQLAQQQTRERFLIVLAVLSLFIVALLIALVLLLRKRKIVLEQKVMDQEQQYSQLAVQLRQFYGKDIATLLKDIADAKSQNKQETQLTKREQEIVRLLCEGLRGKEIAEKLNISIRAVNSHKTNIFNKLGLSSSVELVRFALEHGII